MAPLYATSGTARCFSPWMVPCWYAGSFQTVQSERYPWFASTRVFAPEQFADWPDVMPRIAEALGEFTASTVQRG